jgi:hypothetical protein
MADECERQRDCPHRNVQGVPPGEIPAQVPGIHYWVDCRDCGLRVSLGTLVDRLTEGSFIRVWFRSHRVASADAAAGRHTAPLRAAASRPAPRLPMSAAGRGA